MAKHPAQNPEQLPPDLTTHPLVGAMIGAIDPPPGLIALRGYIGPGADNDHRRLYPTLDFQSYIELPVAAVVATNPADAADPLSPTDVYVKLGTPVETVQVQRSTEPIDSYLQGGITAGHLAAALGRGVGPEGEVQATLCTICPCTLSLTPLSISPTCHHLCGVATQGACGVLTHHCNLFGTQCTQCPCKPSKP
jgi:hypothetical protein